MIPDTHLILYITQIISLIHYTKGSADVNFLHTPTIFAKNSEMMNNIYLFYVKKNNITQKNNMKVLICMILVQLFEILN
jgi:hypothetical protein